MESSELRARVEAREQRIHLLEETLRVLKANTYGPSRERLSTAAGQVELFNEIEATIDISEAVGIEPELGDGQKNCGNQSADVSMIHRRRTSRSRVAVRCAV